MNKNVCSAEQILQKQKKANNWLPSMGDWFYMNWNGLIFKVVGK